MAIDTNRLTDLIRGDGSLATLLGGCEEVYVPLPVLAELKAGHHIGSRTQANRALMGAFLPKPTVRVLMRTLETAEQYARPYAQLKKANTPAPISDLWIAALSIENDLILFTRDLHFQKFRMIQMEGLA